MGEFPTPATGAPARRVVPKCKGSSEANRSWELSFWDHFVSPLQKRRLARNGGDGWIEDDNAENICLIVRVKLTSASVRVCQ